MDFSSDVLVTPGATQPNNSIQLTSPRLKKRKTRQNTENNNNNSSYSLIENKSVDDNSLKNNKIVDKEILQRQNFLESLENKFVIYNEVLEKSKIHQEDNNDLAEICSQLELPNIESEIDFEKKLAQKAELELEMLKNLKKLNQYIDKEQKNQINKQIILYRDQFINYTENDSVTEIDESNVQEKIDQLSKLLSDFYAFSNNNNNLQIDIKNNQNLPLSPRRIHKKIKNNKQSPTVINQSQQSPKQTNQSAQNPFIMRPNNSKVTYNPSLRENSCQNHPILDKHDSQKNNKSIKFVNKNTSNEQVSTPRRGNKSILRVKNDSKQIQNQIDQISPQLNNSDNNENIDQQTNEKFNIDIDNQVQQKKIIIDPSNLVSEPSTPTSSRNSPRHYQKKNPNSINLLINDDNDLLDLNQSPKVLKNNDGKTKNTNGNSTPGQKSTNNSQKPRETTDAMMSKRAQGLLNAAGDGPSDSEPNPNDHHDNPGPENTKSTNKKAKKGPCLSDFIKRFGNLIVDNLENAIGKPHSHGTKRKSDNIALDDPETFKYSNVKADEIVGLDDSEEITDTDYGDYDYDDDDTFAGGGGTGGKSGGGKVKGKGKGSGHHGSSKGEHGSHHRKQAEEINMNGLSKKQEEEILKIYEQGGEIPKGYTVLVGKDGKKMIVQTVYGIEDEDDDEIKFYKEAKINMEIETKEWEEETLRKAKKEKVNKKHRSPPEFDYEVAEDEDFSLVIRRRIAKHQTVIVERDGRKFDERQRRPIETFEYIEVDLEDKKESKTKKKPTTTTKTTKTDAKNSKESKEKVDSKQNEDNEFSSAPRTQLIKRFLEFEIHDIESEGGTIRTCYVPIPPNVEYEWIQEKDDPTTIGKYPKQWGYRWTYGRGGKRIKVCYDKRSFVEEETRDWKGNPTKILKKVRMESIKVDCDDGVKRTIRRPIQKIEFELFEEENEDGTFSIVNRPIIFTQLENGTWKRLDSDHDFFYEQIEVNGQYVLEKRHKEYELVDVECDDGKIRKVKREVQPVEYEEIIDEKTGKKKIVPRQAKYIYVIIEDENGNKIRARREVLDEDEEYEYIGSYDADGNFTLIKQKVKYGYRYDFNGHRIRYRIADHEIIMDEDGNSQQKEIEYEKVEVVLEDGRKVKVLRRKEDFEYVMVTDEKTGETRYEKRKVEYTTTTKVDENGNIITVRTKVAQDFDEVEDGVDENGNVIYKKIPREYETITMKNAKGELITVKRARKYNYETVVDENGVAHQVRKEKIKPKRVRKSVKRLISFPKPLPRSKSFSYLRRYPKHPVLKEQEGGKGIKPSTSISNIHQVIQVLRRGDDYQFSDGENEIFRSLRNDREFYRRILAGAFACRVKKSQLEVKITNARTDLVNAKSKSQNVQDKIDYVLFEIRSKLPKLRLSKPNQTTIKKPPVNGGDFGIQTVISGVEMGEFHMKVKSGMLANKQLSTLTGNNQTLLDYLDKLHRDHQKVLNVVDQHVKEGDGYLATIKIYKPTPDSVAMPPETRRRMELQKSFKALDEKCKKIQAELEDTREKLFFLKRKTKDQECINEMQSGKVDKKKKVPKLTLKELKEIRSRANDENKTVMSQLKLAEIEEESLDEKINEISPHISENEINEITEKIEKMKKKISLLKKQFRIKRKLSEEQAKHTYVLSSKDEIAEFEKRKKLVLLQISNSDKKEQELIDNINGMAKVMQKDSLRIPMDRLVTIYE